MKGLQWLLIILFCAILIQASPISVASGASATSSADEWTTFRHDPSHSGTTTGGDLTDSVKPLWNFSTRAAVWSSPAVVNGCVLVGCKDCNIYCLNASNGQPLWNFQTEGEVNSSPAIYNGFVYVGCDDGWVYCVNFATGMQQWKMKVGGLVRSSPTLLDGCVYVGSGDHDFFCFNATDGNAIWTYPTQYRVDSSPACQMV